MMKCEDVRSIVDAWEEGGKTLDDPEGFRAHLDGCRDCSRRFGALLPLMTRDADISGIEAAPEGFADSVMNAIGERGGRVVGENRGRFAFAVRPALAAAAAAIFVVGLGLGVFFTKLDRENVTVRFVLSAPEASSVYLAGDFNSWNGERYRLKRAGSDGLWEIMVPLRKGKVYVYNFILDGTTWIADPQVPAKIDDGFGGSGSLLRL
jgi:hypothetical protein